jgi:hypothetical protein
MRQHHGFDCALDNCAVNEKQEQRAGHTGPRKGCSSKKSPDELRYLIVEFQRGSPFFTSVEFELLDRACARLAQLEAEGVR